MFSILRDERGSSDDDIFFFAGAVLFVALLASIYVPAIISEYKDHQEWKKWDKAHKRAHHNVDHTPPSGVTRNPR